MMASKHSPQSLRHHFLVASPYLEDPRFHGAVIYICEHSSDGALGLMINQPLDIHLGEILEQLDLQGGELDLPVFSGGPVETERGFVLHSPGDASWQNTAQISDDVMLTTSRDILAGIGHNEGPDAFLMALGYSGWGEGQLEEELGSNAWLTCPATTDILFRTPWAERYSAVLRLIGVDLNQLSETVGHA
ncbi:YqgE/AlgH family protein [Marinobacter sp. ANT_B65]|uniref:YqgE/AlgH family protein n=1 Tax=Marinobacter sp. ANT_B65 TaxID=2039467 RepID=UPI000BBF29BC|nr:YqgE/AlgH family protein [Marinobacter sp. ANT_B65]PCM43943.1 YqgE/AlgH family protein [Marinobacter sp. ANT_B65]